MSPTLLMPPLASPAAVVVAPGEQGQWGEDGTVTKRQEADDTPPQRPALRNTVAPEEEARDQQGHTGECALEPGAIGERGTLSADRRRAGVRRRVRRRVQRRAGWPVWRADWGRAHGFCFAGRSGRSGRWG